MIILLISGKQGSGKSTLASKLEEHLTRFSDSPDFMKLRFAQPLYEMHDEIRNILKKYNYDNYDYSKKDGPLLQMLGTEWGRKNISDNIWVELLTNRLIGISESTIVSVEDCRFENEFDAFNSYPKVLRVRLECNRFLRKDRCSMWRENDNHPSEIGLDKYAEQNKFDLVIHTDQKNDEETFQIVLNKLKELTNV